MKTARKVEGQEMKKEMVLKILDNFAKQSIFNLHWIKDDTDRQDVERIIRAHWKDAREVVETYVE